MSNYVTLIGAEQVQSAGYTMRSASETMSRAARTIDEALSRHERFLDDWLLRLEHILKEVKR